MLTIYSLCCFLMLDGAIGCWWCHLIKLQFTCVCNDQIILIEFNTFDFIVTSSRGKDWLQTAPSRLVPTSFLTILVLLPLQCAQVIFPWVFNVTHSAPFLPPYVCLFFCLLHPASSRWSDTGMSIYFGPWLFSSSTCASQTHPFLLKRSSRGESEGKRCCPVGGRRVDWWSIPATQLVVSV